MSGTNAPTKGDEGFSWLGVLVKSKIRAQQSKILYGSLDKSRYGLVVEDGIITDIIEPPNGLVEWLEE